jgi:hypothetical protein
VIGTSIEVSLPVDSSAVVETDRIPDEAFVVRCGLPPFLRNPLDQACRLHPEGPYGFSVQAAVHLTVVQLAGACRNNHVGFTTAGEIRKMGYEVMRTSGVGWHATVVVPQDWTQESSKELSRLFTQARNPAPRRRS